MKYRSSTTEHKMAIVLLIISILIFELSIIMLDDALTNDTLIPLDRIFSRQITPVVAPCAHITIYFVNGTATTGISEICN